MDSVLIPFRLATSRAALKAYLNTALFAATSAVLFGLASSAYILFYFNYIPNVGLEQVAHLQYHDGPNPWTVESLKHPLMPQQAYDIAVQIDLPRSPTNMKMGNFMINLMMLSPTWTPVADAPNTESLDVRTWIPKDAILFSSRRPAILTYTSEVVTIGRQLARLPSYILGWRREYESLDIPMAEGVIFENGWRNIPIKVFMELQARGHNIEVYSLRLKLRAKFSGLRWLMYNHRILSFLVFAVSFWVAEMVFAVVALLGLQSLLGISDETKAIKHDVLQDEAQSIKTEQEEDLDDLGLLDTVRSFPTHGRQAPPQYVPKNKTEDDSKGVVPVEGSMHPGAAEANDNTEEPVDVRNIFGGGRADSGLATSCSGGDRQSTIQRRKIKGGLSGPP